MLEEVTLEESYQEFNYDEADDDMLKLEIFLALHKGSGLVQWLRHSPSAREIRVQFPARANSFDKTFAHTAPRVHSAYHPSEGR